MTADAITKYVFEGGNERDLLLAQADHCAAAAQREAEYGDPDGMYDGLADEARRLRARAMAIVQE